MPMDTLDGNLDLRALTSGLNQFKPCDEIVSVRGGEDEFEVGERVGGAGERHMLSTKMALFVSSD